MTHIKDAIQLFGPLLVIAVIAYAVLEIAVMGTSPAIPHYRVV